MATNIAGVKDGASNKIYTASDGSHDCPSAIDQSLFEEKRPLDKSTEL